MQTRQSPSKAARANAQRRFQLGPYWLWYRADRDDWSICWIDGRTTRRRSIGIGGGSADAPPQEAQDALAKHYLLSQSVATSGTDEPRGPQETLLDDITRRWLDEHVAGLSDAKRYGDSVLVLHRFFAERREAGLLTGPLLVSNINRKLAEAFMKWRAAEGASPPTISRDLAALRGPINWAIKMELMSHGPKIPEVKGNKRPREREYSVEQVAAILDAAWAIPDRRHVHLYAMIHLSTHGRSEAILELDSSQIIGNLIYFNAPGREQTRKRRSVVPVVPTLAPWLADVDGKVIRYRAPTSAATRLNGGAEYFERDTYEIRGAFEACLLAAHSENPHLDLARQARSANGELIWLPPRKKLGETRPRAKMIGQGSPNTLRHTIHTWHQRQGVPQAQIDAAAGHSTEQGSGRNYTHMRPGYLDAFVASTEAFWQEVGKHTDVHLRYQRDTKIARIG